MFMLYRCKLKMLYTIMTCIDVEPPITDLDGHTREVNEHDLEGYITVFIDTGDKTIDEVMKRITGYSVDDVIKRKIDVKNLFRPRIYVSEGVIHPQKVEIVELEKI